MRRFDSLNEDTKDQVNAMLPAIAKAFKIGECDLKDIVPEDIRMRAWDSQRRDHIKHQPEDDPRNWGVQFLKDLQAIARLLKGDLAIFQADLRRKAEKHEPKHPWCRLADIKELKVKYQNPSVETEPEQSADEYISEPSTEDSYFEELVEQEPPKGGQRRRRNHEVYETRLQESSRRRRKREHGSFTKRLRRDSIGWDRSKKRGHSQFQRISPDDVMSYSSHDTVQYANPAFPTLGQEDTLAARIQQEIVESNETIEVLKLQAELDVAEAELKAARLKLQYLAAIEGTQQHGFLSRTSPGVQSDTIVPKQENDVIDEA